MRNDELPSILLAAGTLILVLLGSLALATTYIGGEDEPVEASAPVVRPRDCLQPNECRVASAELRRAYSDANACDGAGARVCLVPMGDVSKAMIDAVVSHYRRDYGLVIHVARPLDLREGFDRAAQLDESLVYAQMQSAYSKYAADRSITMIGLVPVDLYLAGQPAQDWAFGRLRGDPPNAAGVIEYRNGIVSSFRMDPANAGQPANTEITNQRLLKFLSKYVGLAYYDLPLSSDPTSVLYPVVSSVDALDRVNERIPIR